MENDKEKDEKKQVIKKRGPQKYWDSDTQRVKANYFCKTRGLNFHDPQIRLTVREMLRQKENAKQKKFSNNYNPNTKNIISEIINSSETQDYIKLPKNKYVFEEIINMRLEEQFSQGSLPPPTGYNSNDGTWWDDSLDLLNRKKINYYMDKFNKKVRLPVFNNDMEWIEFFLGDPITGGSLLKPKTKKAFNRLKKLGKLGKLYDIQKEMHEFLEDNPSAKFEVWRGAGKTVLILGKILRRICDNPNECFFFQSETENKTISRIRVIKRELQENQKIIYFYGYLPADSTTTGNKLQVLGKEYKGKWSEGIIELKREYAGIEPTLMGISWQTGRGVGYHYTGGVLDDPWSVKNQNRGGDYKKFWEWWGEFYGSLEEIDFCWVLCTKKGVKDIYTQMDEDKLFAKFRRVLVLEMPTDMTKIEKNGAIISVKINNKKKGFKYVYDDCFGKFTIENAMLIRHKIKPQIFEREYQNNPRQLEGKLLDWNKLRFCDPKSSDRYERMPYEKNRITGVIAYDPAFGVSDSASLNALCAIGVSDKRLYLLKLWIGHWSKSERINAFNEARNMFPSFPFYCENVMQQLRVIRDLTDTTGIFLRPFSPIGQGIKYKNLFDGTKNSSKKARIYDSLESAIEDGRFFVINSIKYFDEFEDEFKNFPDGLKMDVLDSISMAFIILNNLDKGTKILDSNYTPFGLQIKNASIGKTFKI